MADLAQSPGSFVCRPTALAQQSHEESTHSRNSPAEDGVLDYSFRRGGCTYDVLDGRGQPDIGREGFRTLGRERFDRFAAWVDGFWRPALRYSRRDPCDLSSPGKARNWASTIGGIPSEPATEFGSDTHLGRNQSHSEPRLGRWNHKEPWQ